MTTDAGRISFRTVYGGPDAGVAHAADVALLKRQLRELGFAYDVDLLLHLGGEISSAEGASGLYAPRVSVAKRTVTAQIRVRQQDLADAAEPSATLRRIISDALVELVGRVAGKDKSLDASAESAKLETVFGGKA